MAMRLLPNAGSSRLVEFNHNHDPKNGEFSSGTSLGIFNYPRGSTRIPTFLKADVLKAQAAGIQVFHHQQPEPVRSVDGTIHDPLAKSHARYGEDTFVNQDGRIRMSRGRVFISTRGGVFEPTRTDRLDNYGFSQKRVTKDLTPTDLTRPASKGDIVSTFRHEIGHLMRRDFRATEKTPHELASEIVAWQYAVETSTTHRFSHYMAEQGLVSHAYSVFRGEALAKEYGFRGFERDDKMARALQAERSRGVTDPAALKAAQDFSAHVVRSLQNYGAALRKAEAPAKRPAFKSYVHGYHAASQVAGGNYQYLTQPGGTQHRGQV